MAIPVKAIMSFIQKNAKPLAIGGVGVAGGAVAANALNGGANTPQNTSQTQTPTFTYDQYIDASNTINYNITSGGSSFISTNADTSANPKTSSNAEQGSSMGGNVDNMVLPVLAIGGALIVAGVALWQN